MTDSSKVKVVIDKLKDDIVKGNIKLGDRLPSERILAEQIGVSRNCVREARLYLNFLGITETVHGKGTVLKTSSVDDLDRINGKKLLKKYGYDEVIESRRILESGIVKLAAQRATESDKAELKHMLDYLEAIANGEPSDEKMTMLMHCDLEMHHEIAKISRNPHLVEMYQSMSEALFKSRPEHTSIADMALALNPYHRVLIQAICDNDPDSAAKYIDLHFDYVLHVLGKDK